MKVEQFESTMRDKSEQSREPVEWLSDAGTSPKQSEFTHLQKFDQKTLFRPVKSSMETVPITGIAKDPCLPCDNSKNEKRIMMSRKNLLALQYLRNSSSSTTQFRSKTQHTGVKRDFNNSVPIKKMDLKNANLTSISALDSIGSIKDFPVEPQSIHVMSKLKLSSQEKDPLTTQQNSTFDKNMTNETSIAKHPYFMENK